MWAWEEIGQIWFQNPEVLSGEGCDVILWPIFLDVVKGEVSIYFDYDPVVLIFT